MLAHRHSEHATSGSRDDSVQTPAQQKAKSELDAARETRQAAAQTRADADRLGDLTEAKKRMLG